MDLTMNNSNASALPWASWKGLVIRVRICNNNRVKVLLWMGSYIPKRNFVSLDVAKVLRGLCPDL